MNKVSVGAWGATVIWLGIIGWVAYTKRGDFAAMPLNAVGDFLAGTFSPLALCWLVAGYLQQGEALRQNTTEIGLQRDALMLQQRELAEQVKATLQVAAHSEQQAVASLSMVQLTREERDAKENAAIIAIQPKFSILHVESAKWGWSFEVYNDGQDAVDVVPDCEGFSSCQGQFGRIYRSRQKTGLILEGKKPETDEMDFDIKFYYTDTRGTRRFHIYRIRNAVSFPGIFAAIAN